MIVLSCYNGMEMIVAISLSALWCYLFPLYLRLQNPTLQGFSAVEPCLPRIHSILSLSTRRLKLSPSKMFPERSAGGTPCIELRVFTSYVIRCTYKPPNARNDRATLPLRIPAVLKRCRPRIRCRDEEVVFLLRGDIQLGDNHVQRY